MLWKIGKIGYPKSGTQRARAGKRLVFEFPATCEILVASYEVSEGSFARPETVLIGRGHFHCETMMI